MNTTFRISVRELVAFTYFAPDIMPTSMALLAEGTRAHQGRQRSLPTGFEIERPVQATVEHQGASVTVYGRMDAFYPGEGTPLVEEIKLGDGTTLLPAHRAQAVLYAAMLALNEGYPLVKVKVSYVSEEGQLEKAYEETLESAALSDQLHALLNPYVRFALAESQHQALRDESLQTLRFPFAAYRAGQREMAVQVFTAISKRKRLFASLPTGTGKSAAVLYPALKALGQGKTGKLLYLTARTTTRQSPLNVLERMLSQGLVARISVLTAKEKLCPATARCHPDACPRAKGHYLRLAGAIDEIRGQTGIWTDDVICALADKHQLCPFELALSLCELADVVLMDYNYAFDPYAQVQRLFQRRRDMTLLIDEAHHLQERARDMLSGDLDTRTLKGYRQRFAKAMGRKNDFYRSLTKLIHLLQALQESSGNRLSSLPKEIDTQVRATLAQASGLLASALPGGEAMREVAEVLRLMMAFTYASDHLGEEYA
ncbi:MAG: hypothetical protein EOM69_10060, partial [Clostridia bacterium]|nr:hypothetical protein [Clostridia bacterium]